MSIADNATHRARWQTKLARVQAQIADLRTEIDIALQSRVQAQTMIELVEADVHLATAASELGYAARRIRSIP